MRYLGHLDMMRYFQKAVLKAGLDVKYTEGYHPHQIMAFAYPLAVGMETYGDYADIEFNTVNDPEEIVKKLNEVMREGTYATGAVLLPEKALNAMAAVEAADYEVIYDIPGCSCEEVKEASKRAVETLLSSESVTAGKTGKNIREGILFADVSFTEDENRLILKLLSGSKLNARPADVFNAFAEAFGERKAVSRLIRRLEIYGKNEQGELVPLGSEGVL